MYEGELWKSRLRKERIRFDDHQTVVRDHKRGHRRRYTETENVSVVGKVGLN